MLAAIVTDTHDHLENIRKIVEIVNAEQADCLIHAGDFVAPFALISLKQLKAPVHAVFGNNDGERKGLQAKAKELGFEIHDAFHQFELDGRGFLLHHYPLAEKVIERDFADREFIITGHTHEKKIERVESTGALLINPGEACGYLTGAAEFGLLDLKSGEYQSVALPSAR
ncbi:metallophosphoesterase [Candidatus Sumerlaeota bacterium]|nr:metallophosphoesterase [Candidatus Sumerlaeota bacterium]